MNEKLKENVVLTVWDELRKTYVYVTVTRNVSGLIQFNPEIQGLTEDDISYMVEHAVESFTNTEYDEMAYFNRPVILFEDMPQEILDNEE